jgi:phasin family protein
MPMTPKFQADLTKAFATFKLPQVDLQALTEFQSKNVDAMLQAGQVLADAGKAVARHQFALASAVVEDAMRASQLAFEARSPEAQLATQIDATKAAYGRVTQAAKELAELMAKPGQKAADILQKRMLAQSAELEALVASAA